MIKKLSHIRMKKQNDGKRSLKWERKPKERTKRLHSKGSKISAVVHSTRVLMDLSIQMRLT